jgi:hypothetical protein
VRFHRFVPDPLAARRISLSILIVFVSCLLGSAQSSVTVVNPPSNPVPVNVTGTVPVSGSVNAAVTGNVGIVGTPAVSVQSPSAPPTQIGGQVITPVLVRDMDERARHPFEHDFNCNVKQGGGVTCVDVLIVPEQKELVIEYVQFYGVEPTNNTVVTYLLNTVVGGLGRTFYYPRGPVTWSNVPMTHELTRIYADPGSHVTFTGVANSDAGMRFAATISGYLIDLP